MPSLRQRITSLEEALAELTGLLVKKSNQDIWDAMMNLELAKREQENIRQIFKLIDDMLIRIELLEEKFPKNPD